MLGIIDKKKQAKGLHNYPLKGNDEWFFRNFKGTAQSVIVTSDSPNLRRLLIKKYNQSGFVCESLNGGKIDPYSKIGRYALIQKHAHVSVNCTLGEGVKLNYGANVMHDCVLGDYVTVAPNAVLLGYVKVGAGSFIGANATILPHCEIGDNATIGAGAVVTKNISPGLIVKGVPAK